MGSTHHDWPINVLLASLFGKYTADTVKPYQANTRIAWQFRLFLANQLPKTGSLGETSVEDWRRALIMMYKGALFSPEEFQTGEQGEGLNLSIQEFKKLQNTRQNDWIAEVQGSSKIKSEESELEIKKASERHESMGRLETTTLGLRCKSTEYRDQLPNIEITEELVHNKSI